MLSRLSAFAGAALLLAGLAAPAAAMEATANYAISLGGNNVAELTIRLADGNGRYELEASANIAGMASLVASGSGKVKSSGISTASGLVSERFDFLTRSQGEDFTVLVTYANKDVQSFIVTPPLLNNIDRVAIERKHLRGVNDMVAAFILKGGKLDSSLCNRKMQIFTGLERFNVALKFAKEDEATSKRTGYQGPVILCNIRYTPVSGHFTTSEVTNYLADSDRILIWYLPMQTPGMFIPYRILLTTSMGDLSMVLTKLTQ